MAAGMGAAGAQPRASAVVFISPSGEPFRPTPSGPPPFEAWFSKVDARHDGRIDRADFRADAVAFFHRLDANGDGVIDGFEISAYEKTIAPELNEQTDAGGAGRAYFALLNEPEPVSGADLALDLRITMAEWLAATDRRFDLLDPRKTGFLDHDALVARLPKAARAGLVEAKAGKDRP
jgi:Ca2+-binding EF-hand superfamily protein